MLSKIKIKKCKHISVLFLVLFCSLNTFAQLLYHQDIFYGGVTGGGFSTGLGAGSGTISLYIETGSTIRKAFLVCQRYQSPQPITITVNGLPYLLDSNNDITSFMILNSGHITKSGVNLIDITSDINPNQLNYNVNIPVQNNGFPETFYNSVYIIILYENSNLQKINVNIILNNQTLEDMNNKIYNLQFVNPINTNNPVGFAIHTDRVGDTLLLNDGSNVFFNNSHIGLIGGTDMVNNLWSAGGVKGNFYYQNDSLFGLDDDTPDSMMSASDGLADVSSNIINGATSYNFNLIWQDISATSRYNIYSSFYLTYTTPCDTFTTTITPNDTLCLGDSVQLQATGGVQYSWFGVPNAFGSGLSDTSIANPTASPPQTTTYIVTIKNDSGCVKTEQVKIWVNPLPVADTLIVSNNFCGDSVGSITIGNIPNGTSPFNYTLTNLQTGTFTTQNNNVFNQLSTFNFQLLTVDANGCQFTDTATVTQTNNVQSNFTANPQNGIAPLNVDFMNTSLNANSFEWWVLSGVDTLAQNSSLNTQHLFENSGNFQMCLVAYNNIPVCADTLCTTIAIKDEISFVIPNVFTPNNDYNNDNFVIQLTGISLIKSLKVEVFNRWGETVKSGKYLPLNTHHSSPTTQYTIWDGRTTAGKPSPSGTYFYVITYTTTNNKTKTEKGTVTLLR